MRRIRAAVLTLGLLTFAAWALLHVLLAWISGEVDVWFRSGRRVYSHATEGAAFYFWLGVEALAGCVLLALALCSAFLLFSKRRSTFTDTLVGVLQQRNPSGLRPLWIGLAIAGGAFAIYIAVSG